ncbi:MAG: polyhydroxyalkanoate synthesis repressor PhaR [Formivibrio sp.]|nr:polyhydroxyalkanoate synthesis repressor PhaR [Formivibrio sp.]
MNAEKRVIKKYPNRRLYDTSTSSYITLADVKQLVLSSVDIQVLDARSGEDLTRSVLMQIIMDEEAGAMPMFSHDALTQMIRFYGNAMQGLMGNFLDKNLHLFMEMQGKASEQAESVLKGDATNFANPGLWGDFMKYQGPALQKMMGDYLESGASMFMQMQQQMNERASGAFDAETDMPAESVQESAAAPAEPAPAASRAKTTRKPATKS